MGFRFRFRGCHGRGAAAAGWSAELAEEVDVVVWDAARGTGHLCVGECLDCVYWLDGMRQLVSMFLVDDVSA